MDWLRNNGLLIDYLFTKCMRSYLWIKQNHSRQSVFPASWDKFCFKVYIAFFPLSSPPVAKPFCEVSIVQRLTSPTFSQYKYLAMLIQEFHIKVELPFVYAIIEVLYPSKDVSDSLYSVSCLQLKLVAFSPQVILQRICWLCGGWNWNLFWMFLI